MTREIMEDLMEQLLPLVVGASVVLMALVGARELLKEIGMAMTSSSGH